MTKLVKLHYQSLKGKRMKNYMNLVFNDYFNDTNDILSMTTRFQTVHPNDIPSFRYHHHHDFDVFGVHLHTDDTVVPPTPTFGDVTSGNAKNFC